jgi:hypothetical protein
MAVTPRLLAIRQPVVLAIPAGGPERHVWVSEPQMLLQPPGCALPDDLIGQVGNAGGVDDPDDFQSCGVGAHERDLSVVLDRREFARCLTGASGLARRARHLKPGPG